MGLLEPLNSALTLPTEAILLLPDGKQMRLRITRCEAHVVQDPYQFRVSLDGVANPHDHISPLVAAPYSTGEPHDAGGEMWALRCPRCGDFAEAHECSGAHVRVDRPEGVEAPVVVPESKPPFPGRCGKSSPHGRTKGATCQVNGEHFIHKDENGLAWTEVKGMVTRVCGERHVTFPRVLCHLEPGHAGNHVNSTPGRGTSVWANDESSYKKKCAAPHPHDPACSCGLLGGHGGDHSGTNGKGFNVRWERVPASPKGVYYTGTCGSLRPGAGDVNTGKPLLCNKTAGHRGPHEHIRPDSHGKVGIIWR